MISFLDELKLYRKLKEDFKFNKCSNYFVQPTYIQNFPQLMVGTSHTARCRQRLGFIVQSQRLQRRPSENIILTCSQICRYE